MRNNLNSKVSTYKRLTWLTGLICFCLGISILYFMYDNQKVQDQKDEKIRYGVLQKAQELAKQYKYDEAVGMIQSTYSNYESDENLAAAVATFNSEKSALVAYDGPVAHIFFHSLIADKAKAFDGDKMTNGYNNWMVTVGEFNVILEQLYERGYILVDIHDVVGYTEENGKKSLQKKNLLLPKGKKPLILSQDDVCYYEYMEDDGFAKRMVLDEEGKPACELIQNGTSIVKRDFDVVPLLDVFVEKHPDFSYHGAKGIIAVTGYEGALGYRINDETSKTLESDRESVKALSNTLRNEGWEFASHSYTHNHLGKVSLEKFNEDTESWKEKIEPYVGSTDVYIYPFGEEVKYSSEQLKKLQKEGFSYFCCVYKNPWMEVKDSYMRMTRLNIDGYTMHYYPERCKDLFDVNVVLDQTRPAFQ